MPRRWRKADITFVDAPVSGGTAGADKATLAIMLACAPDTYERVKPLMSLMGKPFYVGPKPGQGQAVKMLNNFLSATALAASSEAIAFGVSQGIAMQTVLDIVNASTGRNTATEDKFPRRIINEKYDAGFTAKLQLKDIKLYLENARAAGIADQIAGTVVDVWTGLDTAMPGADITLMYPYTRDGRKPRRRGIAEPLRYLCPLNGQYGVTCSATIGPMISIPGKNLSARSALRRVTRLVNSRTMISARSSKAELVDTRGLRAEVLLGQLAHYPFDGSRAKSKH